MNFRPFLWLMTALLFFSFSQLSFAKPASRPTTRKAAPHKKACVQWDQLNPKAWANARKCFQSLKKDRQEEALIGLLTIARMKRDLSKLPGLLQQVAALKKRSPSLFLTAASAALLSVKTYHQYRGWFPEICKLKKQARYRFKAASICSMSFLLKEYGVREVCTAGCKKSQTMTMNFAGNSPVIKVGINQAKPSYFIVDTGASTSVITKAFARKIGLKLDPKTHFKVNSPGGLLPTWRALVTVRIGSLVLKRVPVVVLDLPIDFVAGILSPQTTLRQFDTSLDFRNFRVTIAPVLTQLGASAALPLLLSESNPMVFLKAGKRPARPFTLDTGAVSSRMKVSYDKLGDPPLKRLFRTRTKGAGGKSAASWVTRARLPVRIDSLRWVWKNPVLMQQKDESFFVDARRFGLLGMDFLMGRVLTLHNSTRHLAISQKSQMLPWKVGSKATFEVSLMTMKKKILITETVHKRKGRQVTLKIDMKHPKKPERFFLSMTDDWKSRGSWLLARPARKAWNAKGKLSRRQLMGLWMKAFVGFRVIRGKVKIAMIQGKLGKQTFFCSRVQVRALTIRGRATLSLVQCPQSPWRTLWLKLKTDKGNVLWQYKRQGFSTLSFARK